LPHARELTYASERLTSIEINGTFYRTQSPATSPSGRRDAGRLRVLRERRALRHQPQGARRSRESVDRFLKSGVLELGDKLGPICGSSRDQKFDPDDFGAFLELLPRSLQGRALRHVVEVRHASFCVPEFVALLASTRCPWCLPSTPLSGHSDPVGDSCISGCRRAGQRRHLLSAQRPGRVGKAGRNLGQGGTPKDLARSAMARPPRLRRAMCSSISSTKAKCGPGRGHGNDQAGGWLELEMK
jgi:hypothetical protein